jgi:hypothetical protein
MGLFDTSDMDRPCRQCEHWGGDIAEGSHALCLRGPGRQVQAQPDRGCVYWVRCIGADDEPGIADAASNRARR